MENIFSNIDSCQRLSYNESFDLASKCSYLLSLNKEIEEEKARRVIIHILNNWNKLDVGTQPIWADLIESVGFYPYIDKNSLEIQSLSDEIRIESYKSDYLQGTYLHSKQKELSNLILGGKNVIASAPTSFGKSLLIEEIIASKKYKNIVIIQPTLALLDETRLKLKKYTEDYKVIVRTSQPFVTNKGNLFLLTAERVMEYENLPSIDLLIIDEFYKLSLRRSDERADTLNNAFLKIVNNNTTKFYFLGPNIDGILKGFAEKYNAVFYKSNFSLVDCNVIDYSHRINHRQSIKKVDEQKLNILSELLDSLSEEQTLIYCSTPARARRFAKGYLDHLIKVNSQKINTLPLVEWIDENVSPKWSLSDELKYGIAIHDGSLQKHVGSSIIGYFNKGFLRCIFCTSTIIEGVNTSAKNVILLDGKKGGQDIDFFDYSNIKGRSGRLMEHYVGNIYNFVPPPTKQEVFIDIPLYEQNPISDEILINIPKEDVRQNALERYDQLYETDAQLLEIIKKNGVSVNGQLSVYFRLEKDIYTDSYTNIAWSRMPSWDNILYILDLAENTLLSVDHHGVSSIRQLAFYLSKYKQTKNIMDIVNDIYSKKMKAPQKKETLEKNSLRYFDEAIEWAYHIHRHWFQFTVPKVFRVVDSLQRYVCEKRRRKAGSYSYYVQQLENDFITENLSILIEFGLPVSAVRKLENKIPSDLTEDEIISFLKKNKEWLTGNWSRYEKEKLELCL